MAAKREVIDPRSGKRYVRRNKKGEFTEEQVDVGRSLTRDRATQAKTRAKKGQGDKGDR